MARDRKEIDKIINLLSETALAAGYTIYLKNVDIEIISKGKLQIKGNNQSEDK